MSSIAPSLVLSAKLDIVESLRARWFLIYALVFGAMVLAVARHPEAYRHLVESIRRFPDQAEFTALLRQAGFVNVRFEDLLFGIACLHFASRPHDPAVVRGPSPQPA